MSSEEESLTVRTPYTLQEDLKILNHIIRSNGFDKVKGVTLWMDVEKALEEEGIMRTWQSIKERFRKTIIRNISHYDLNDEVKAKVLAPYTDKEIKQPCKGKRGHRRSYTFAEDKALALYVLRNPETDVRGNVIWRNLEEADIIKGRSWMSLRNRFLNHVIDHLDDVLNTEDALAVQRIVRGDLPFVDYGSSEEEYRKTGKRKKGKAGKKRPLCRDDWEPSNDATIPSTSRGLHCRPRTTLLSESDDSLANSPRKIPGPIESGSEEKLSDSSEVNNAAPSGSSSVTGRGMPMPVVLLKRCDATDNHEKTGSSDSTIFNATTMILLNSECCCDDLDSSKDPLAFCSSECRTLIGPSVVPPSVIPPSVVRPSVGPPVPLSVMTAEAMLRADRTDQEDDWITEFTLSTEMVQAPRQSKRLLSAQTAQTDNATTHATVPTDSVFPLGSQQSVGTSLQFSKDPENSREEPQCLEEHLESQKMLSVFSLENRESIEVKSDRETLVIDRRPGQTSTEADESDKLGTVSSDEEGIGNSIDSRASLSYSDNEPETFKDPLFRVTVANIVVTEGSNLCLGVPKFPIVDIL